MNEYPTLARLSMQVEDQDALAYLLTDQVIAQTEVTQNAPLVQEQAPDPSEGAQP
jgi:hypothetical protein